MSRARCRCHSDRSLYGSLVECPRCHHWSLDPDVGCERRKCAYEVPAIQAEKNPAERRAFSEQGTPVPPPRQARIASIVAPVEAGADPTELDIPLPPVVP